MSAAPKQPADWKSYDRDRPKVSLRIPRDDKQALDAALNRRGETISNLMLAYLRPIIAEGTPEGQRAHDIISTAVQASVAWNVEKSGGGYGDTIADGDATVWNSMTVIPRKTPSDQKVWYHIITQREGQRRAQAIAEYVHRLMDEWGRADVADRERMLREISDPSAHRFIVGRSRFAEWQMFEDARAMASHYDTFQRPFVKAPQIEMESAFIAWAIDVLRDAWEGRDRRRKADTLIIREGQDGGDDYHPVPQSFRYYPIRRDDDNIAAWAGVWMNRYHMLSMAGLNHDQVIAEMAKDQIQIKMLRLMDTE